MFRTGYALGMALAVLAPAARAQNVPAAPDRLMPAPYVAKQQVSGEIRIWGHGALGRRIDFIERLTEAWEEGFRKHHPGIRFDNKLKGTASAIGALCTGTGDIALMGREIWEPEVAAYKEVFGYPPLGVDVMTGSFNVRNRGYAITFFVNKDNPVRSLSLAQLDAMFSVERRRGHKPIRTWGDVGLGGAWKDAPINLYGLPIARGFADYLQDRIFLGSPFWNPTIREFADQPNSVSKTTDGAPRMLAALARDRFGIGYAGLVYEDPGTRPIAIAEADGGPAVAASLETVRDHSYPLTRIITLFLNRAPGRPADPKVAEFVRYILSREGQRTVEAQGEGYLPMLAPFAAREIEKLEK
jgi:phosphate transport system substrate-binding protein